MDRRTLYKSLLSTLGYVAMFIFLGNKLNGHIEKYSMVFLIVGALLLYFNERIARTITEHMTGQTVARKLIQVFSYIILFLGIKQYLKVWVADYGWLMFIAGMVVFSYHSEIIDKLHPVKHRKKK